MTEDRHSPTRTAEALRESEMMLRESQSIAHVGSYILDISTGFWRSSDELDKIFGIDQTYDHTVEGWIALIHPEDRAMMTDYFQNEVVAQGRTFDKEYRILRRTDQAEVWVHGLGWLEYDASGQPFKMHGTIQDINDRKQAEAMREKLAEQLQQAQKMESIGRLAGGIAHDFNNMLGVILGHTEMAMNQMDPSAPLYSDLKAIHNAAQRSAELTRQLLAFGRKQTVTPKIIDINETVTGMLKMLKRLIGEEIELLWLPAAGLWPVKIDSSQIDQILVNLCINARDAISGIGKITLQTGNQPLDKNFCVTHEGATPGDYVLLTLTDNGSGMDEETLSHLFEPFFTTKEPGKGTGLGLATVYGIVKQNNGFITVRSEPLKGTSFGIYLPRVEGRAEQTRLEEPSKAPPRGSETILLVEDEPTMLRIATLMLEKQGYTVLATEKPSEAIRLARVHADNIDLLVTDVVMPEMNGLELSRKIQAAHPHLRHLFISAYAANYIGHSGKLNEATAFIQKPFSLNELATKVRELIDHPSLENRP